MIPSTQWLLGNLNEIFWHVILKQILVIDGWCISCEIALRWMPLNLTDDKSTLVQVMAWCRQATIHYLNHCWLRSLSPYRISRPQWIKHYAPYNNDWCSLGWLLIKKRARTLLIRKVQTIKHQSGQSHYVDRTDTINLKTSMKIKTVFWLIRSKPTGSKPKGQFTLTVRYPIYPWLVRYGSFGTR